MSIIFVMEMKWSLPRPLDSIKVMEFASTLEVSPVIARILLSRGYEDPEITKRFLSPSLLHLEDPFSIIDMKIAVERILQAIDKKEHILIHGDYDVDGITGTALLYLVIKDMGGFASYYLPDRLTHGYGFSSAGVLESAQRGAKLIITVDCGITSMLAVEEAKKFGIDCIITDHHEPENVIPSAFAVVNPHRKESTGYGRELAGVGVAFKLLQGLKDCGGKISLEEHLDLVAIGTIADIVPLVGESRVFAKEGLIHLQETRKIGLRKLIELCGLLGKKIESGHVVYILAPRLNAVGRLGDAERGLKLLIAQDEEDAMKSAIILNNENMKRQRIDEEIFESAQKRVKNEIDLKKEKVIVLASDDWHQGVIGIVASRLVEQFYRPTVLISLIEDYGKGSARSIPGFDFFEGLKQCQGLLLTFGGHKYACGLSLERNKISEFKKRLNEVAEQFLSTNDLIPQLHFDTEMYSFKEINENLLRELEMLAPFGAGNRQPVFLAQNLQIVGYPRVVGNNHLRFKVREGGKVIDAIAYSLGEMIIELDTGTRGVNLGFSVEEEEWQGKKNFILKVRDVKVGGY